MKSKNNPPIDVQIVDVTQCFDGLWPEECINDLYHYGLQNDGLPLFYDGCSENEIQVKTHIGITQSAKLDKNGMQGDVWGPPACSVNIDKSQSHH